MEHEQSHVKIALCNGGTGFIIGRQVGQFVISAKGFAVMSCANTACQVILFAYDVVPNAVNSFDIGTVSSECSDIRHAGIHVACTYSMTPSFVLFDYGQVALCVDVACVCFASIV